MIYIVGIGPGSKEYILPKATETLTKSDIIIGFSRAINSIEHIKGEKIVVQKLGEILEIMGSRKKDTISIVASGDPGFYGISDYMKKNVSDEIIEIIPGISSFQYMMSKIQMSWQDAFLGSVHGRYEDFINVVKNNKVSIFLTDYKNSPRDLARQLFSEGIECNIWVGENLSYDDERIIKGKPEEIKEIDFSGLSVFVVEVY
ncbi:MAG: precorrin-6y C5,15-methyltransferase (decarboxylating) subunit CbiE [Clostridium sp.]|nr:precorrin-6y C5,15-methyltransferase (decarboxylating) subunit CbiE [Clostridium sp.]